ncbi:MAG: hypothetical protein PHY47_12770 [Lachnospiraceae bacterium]|nr:hypothetical protein [Lachnospiraceae bacterium]
MINKVFVSNDLLRKKVQNTLKLNIIEESLAEISGKMFYILRNPILLKLDDITYTRGHKRVFGTILTFNQNDIENTLYILDNFNGCSMSRTGINHPLDLTYRTISQVYPIKANNIHELESFDYSYGKKINCWVYYGNINHSGIIKAVANKHNKLLQGFYPKGFKEVLKRHNLLPNKE